MNFLELRHGKESTKSGFQLIWFPTTLKRSEQDFVFSSNFLFRMQICLFCILSPLGYVLVVSKVMVIFSGTGRYTWKNIYTYLSPVWITVEWKHLASVCGVIGRENKFTEVWNQYLDLYT